jgi:uncharacterized membrane protein YoaK (UPF0700 family)
MNSFVALLSGTGLMPEIVIIPFFAAWVWAMIDCLITKRLQPAERVVWLIALVLLSLFAAIGYWITRYVSKKRHRAAPATN